MNAKPSPLTRLSSWKKSINSMKCFQMYCLKKRIYYYLEKSQILNDANNEEIFVVVCFPTPEFNKTQYKTSSLSLITKAAFVQQ